MSVLEDYGHFLLLGAGLVMLNKAGKRKPRKLEDRTGEECDPNESAPYGYECGQTRGGWELRKERGHFVGFGSYINQEGVDEALAYLGFPNGNLSGFQSYVSLAYQKDLRIDGIADRATMIALKEAEMMLGRDEWVPPRGAMTG